VAGGQSTARKARKYPRRKIVGVAEQDVAGFVKVVDLLECGHINWPPSTRGAGAAAWTICEKCPPKHSEVDRTVAVVGADELLRLGQVNRELRTEVERLTAQNMNLFDECGLLEAEIERLQRELQRCEEAPYGD